MEEITTLIIAVKSDQADAAAKRLAALGYNAKVAETGVAGLTKATDGFMATLKSLLGPLAAFLTIQQVGSKLIGTARQFEVLNAQLKTATGSAQGAATAFEALVQFAQTTPYDLPQTVDAFVKLTNLGLIPSERALRSYGNTASALGHSLEDMVLAVSNATVGQFINLRQFGIKASSEAEGVRFTFQGTSTLVKNSAKDIQEYFVKLGETKFPEAMAARMLTLDGALSNVADTWDQLFVTISKAGLGDLMTKAVNQAQLAIQDLTAEIASGALVARVDALWFKFSSLFDGIAAGFDALNVVFQQSYEYWTGEGIKTSNFLRDAFTKMPENIRAAMQLLGATISALTLAQETAVKAFINLWIAGFRLYVDLAGAAGKAALDVLTHPMAQTKNVVDSFVKDANGALNRFGTSAKTEAARVVTAVAGIGTAWEESVVATLDERDAAINAFKLQWEGADRLRKKYDDLAASKAAAAKGKDRLAGFAIGGDDRNISEEERHRFENLRDTLRAEEYAITESYKKRLELIRGNTKEGSDLRVELERALNLRVTEEYEKAFIDRNDRILKLEADLAVAIAAGRMAESELYKSQLEKENADIRDIYEKRKADIIANATLTEEQKAKALAVLKSKNEQADEQRALASQRRQLDYAAGFFGNLSTIAGAFGRKGAKAAQAAAIVQATIKTYESATGAYSAMAGIPVVGPALGVAAAAAAIAAGMANVAAIRSQNYSGAYDTGGMIPAGEWGLVGEYGPEPVRGPAIVGSRRSMEDRRGGANPQNLVIQINNSGAAVQVTSDRQLGDQRIIEIAVARSKAELTKEVDSGDGPFNRALVTRTNVRRTA